jgi:hypothetical protein
MNNVPLYSAMKLQALCAEMTLPRRSRWDRRVCRRLAHLQSLEPASFVDLSASPDAGMQGCDVVANQQSQNQQPLRGCLCDTTPSPPE